MTARVAVVTNMWPGDGAAHRGLFVQEQVEAVRRAAAGWTVDVIRVAGRRGRIDYLAAATRLRRELVGYDLVHAHYGLTGAAVALARVPIPGVLTLHGGDVNVAWQRVVSSLAARRFERVLVVDGAMRRWAAFATADVLPCGVDVSRFAMPRSRSDAGRRTILFPGDPADPVKDHALFQRAIDGLRPETRDLVDVITLGGVDPKDVPARMADADVVVLTSRSEGSPMVVKEALAAGAPVVSVAVGDVAALIEGAPGCRVVARTAAEIARGIEAALRDGRGEADRARRARIVERGLDGDSVARRLIELYEKTIAAHGRNGRGTRARLESPELRTEG